MAARRINRRFRPQGIIDLPSQPLIHTRFRRLGERTTMVPWILGASERKTDTQNTLSGGDSRKLLA
jgi:hypothetical protein